MYKVLRAMAVAGTMALSGRPARGDDPAQVYVGGGYHWAQGFYSGGRFYLAPGYYYYTPGYYRAAPSGVATSHTPLSNVVHQTPGRPSIARQVTAPPEPGRPWSPSVGGNFQAGGYGGMPHYLHARGWDSGAHAEWLRQEQARRRAPRP
ncbi:MAG: hypothetical protein U0790_17560 [Isosphaeraceae bacterium]